LLTLFIDSTNSDSIAFHISDEGNADSFNSDINPSISIQQLEQLPLEELLEKIDDLSKHKITVVIPGEQVTTKVIQTPKGSKRHIHQAIPYLLEDDLAAPVEELHFALGKPNSKGQILCAVISKGLLSGYLEKLAELDIHPSFVIPDYWLLENSDVPEYIEYRQRHLIRLADNTGMALPAGTPEELLKQALSTQHVLPIKQALPTQQASTDTAPVPTALSADLNQQQALEQEFHLNQAPINLLQGDYTPAASQTNARGFKPVAIAAGVCIALFMTYFVAMGWYFNQQTQKLSEQAKANYQQWFPNESRILNIRRQMTAHINNSGGQQQDGLFFELTSAVSQAVNSENEKATIRHIRYDRNDATLQLELQAKSMGYSHKLQSQIQKMGFAAEVLSANSNDEGVIARLKLSKESSLKQEGNK